jgi:hypothetical protein
MHLTAMKVGLTSPIVVASMAFATVPQRRAHGQYQLWQRRPGESDRAGSAATYRDQSRRLEPREGDGRA